MVIDIGKKAETQNAALLPFEGLLGEWTTTGTHPAIPNAVLHGKASFAWENGGAFLIWRSEIEHLQFPAGVAIFGSDDDAGIWWLTYFDERGVSRKYEIKLRPDGFIMERLTPKFSQRMTFTIEEDRIVSRGEMSRDGGAWEGDLSLTYDRVK
jgi:hypothetical protein